MKTLKFSDPDGNTMIVKRIAAEVAWTIALAVQCGYTAVEFI
jgi:hypothetical protein